jgi:hypothetical protein
LLILVILLVMIFIGYPLGILTEDPDGLERVLIDQNGESWLEGLTSVWIPFLSWIENNYIAAIIGVLLSVIIIFSVFKLISYKKGR